MKWFVCALLLGLVSVRHIQAQPLTAPPSAVIPHVDRAPTLDAYMSEGVRPPALEVSGFVQRRPGDGIPASRATSAYLSYDSRALYVVFECREEPGDLRAHLSRREDIAGDDSVSVSLDTFRDGQRAYMFFANPLGVQMDGVTTEGQEDDFEFDAIWTSEGRLTPSGFLVLMAIPFKSLRFAPSDDMEWGIALSRFRNAAAETDTWPHLSERVSTYVPNFARVRGLRGVSGQSHTQWQPYQSFAIERGSTNAPSSAASATQSAFRAGLDAKVILRESTALDLTVNPDFSQVESDEPQVTINQRYEVYFPEKRPFFNEGAGLFATPETLLFTRRIVDPSAGVRLTAKSGSWVVAGLGVRDRGASGQVDGRGDGTMMIGRIFREQGNLKVGGLWTLARNARQTNQVGAADGRWVIAPTLSVNGQVIASRELDTARPTSGAAVYGGVHQSSRHWTSDTDFRYRTPGFRGNTLGFFRRTNLQELAHYTRYYWRPSSGPLVSYGPAIDAEVNWDTRGQLQDWFVETPVRVNTVGPTSITVARREMFERYRDVPLRYGSSSATISTALGRVFDVRAKSTFGTRPNYYPADGIPALGHATDISATLTVKPGSRWRLAQTYIRSDLGTAAPASGRLPRRAIFTDTALRTRATFQVSRPLSLRVIADYDDLKANAALVSLEPDRSWNVDVLATYLLHPGTAVYVGYSSRGERYADGEAAEAGGFITERGRQFFVKTSVVLRP